MDAFNERLKAARKRKKLKQKELADILNVSKSSISEWESGKHRPSTEQITNICNALEIDPNWLFGEEYSNMLREIPADYYLLENGELLPAEAKKELDSFIDYLKTGIRPGTINAYYHGFIKRMNVKDLIKICDALNCRLDELIEYIPDKNNSFSP